MACYNYNNDYYCYHLRIGIMNQIFLHGKILYHFTWKKFHLVEGVCSSDSKSFVLKRFERLTGVGGRSCFVAWRLSLMMGWLRRSELLSHAHSSNVKLKEKKGVYLIIGKFHNFICKTLQLAVQQLSSLHLDGWPQIWHLCAGC